MNAFEKIKEKRIPELDCALTEWKHKNTGAEIIHIKNEDPENFFSISFQTVPENSSGVAHVLEHVVLAGSKKYPVKDPFFSMMRRSLNTYLNALTGADHTSFPAASQCKKDFYHLLDVYLDAVFHPKLDRFSFLQEGIRLDFDKEGDIASPLVFKGVVFNEMKGALSSPSHRLHEAMQSALFRVTTYGVNSGGDPKEIEQLSYKSLKEFWEKFYRPERALFFFYGSFPIEEHLDYLEENFFIKLPNSVKEIKTAPVYSLIEPRRSEKIYKTLFYPISSEEEKSKTMASFGWLTASMQNSLETLSLSVLALILMDNDSSPLKKALLESGLVKQASCFLDTEMPDVPFTLSLKGVEPEKIDQIEELIFSTLKEIVARGIDKNEVDRACHQLEFGKSEIGGDSTPFGLQLFFRAGLLKHHGLSVEEGLEIHALFHEMEETLKKSPRFLEDLLERYLIKNNHFVRILFLPDLGLLEKEHSEEKARLAQIERMMSPKEKKLLIQENEALQKYQREQEEQDISCLPTLTVEDIPKEGKDFPLHAVKKNGQTVYSHETFTNGIFYLDRAVDLSLSSMEKNVSWIRLLTILLTEIGTKKRAWAPWLEDLQAYTGGLGAFLSFNIDAQDHRQFSPTFHVKGKALFRYQKVLLEMMQELFESPRFEDENRILRLIEKRRTQAEHAITQNALHYATTYSASGLSLASSLSEKSYGIGWLHFLRKAAAEGPFLQELYSQAIKESRGDWIACGDAALLKKFSLEAPLKEGVNGRSAASFHQTEKKATAFLISSPVAFSALSLPTVSYADPDSPKLMLAAHIMDNLLLHRKLREEGGAYGGGAQAHTLSGIFSFYSYRDPKITSTFQAFQEAIELIASGNFESEDIQEAIFESIQALDSPVAPGSRADVAYSWLRENKTLLLRQQFRRGLLSADKEGIMAAVNAHLLPKILKACPVIFCGKELIEREKSSFIDLGYGEPEILIP